MPTSPVVLRPITAVRTSGRNDMRKLAPRLMFVAELGAAYTAGKHITAAAYNILVLLHSHHLEI